MPESLQHKLDRVRAPRVHITYDVEIGDAIEMKEIPFVVGVLADLSGKPDQSLPKMKDRKFIEIDRDNFDQVLEGMSPRLAYRVDNIYDVCQRLMDKGVVINRPPRDGHMAFVRSPDGISIELLQAGESLAPEEPWASMENTGSW